MSAAAPLLPRTAPPHEVLRAVLEALDRGARVVLASVVDRRGSAPSTPGQKLVLLDARTAIGTVGGGAVERVVLERMQAALVDRDARPRLETFRLGASLGMCCGGSADILIEPIEPPLHVLVVGAGHVGVFTAPLLASLVFRVTLVDAREAAADPARLPPVPAAPTGLAEGVRLVHGDHDDPETLHAFPADLGRAAALVMTHDHALDQVVIEWALGRGFGFVGGVGSRAKAVRTRDRLEAKGFSAADIARVRMPVGVDIGARAPAEIGVAIAAELVAWRASRGRGVEARAREDAGAPSTFEGRTET
ncbi:Xanthine and CO dehydrogenases maturation factor, XdhC/CoxF family protein [Minicystis rosea]|nr:Xanthine and CO dehydrogenases maturation factor, XdhC/CoxF family protein [Minicystis rosea]